MPQPEDRLAPARGPSCPCQRTVLPQPEGRLAPARGPSCPSQRTVLPQPEDRLAPARGPSCPSQRNFPTGTKHICLQYEHIKEIFLSSFHPVRPTFTFTTVAQKKRTGETKRTLGTRIKEQKEDAEKALASRPYTRSNRKTSKKEITKRVTDHMTQQNHVVDWEGAKFVDRESDWRTRGVKEAI